MIDVVLPCFPLSASRTSSLLLDGDLLEAYLDLPPVDQARIAAAVQQAILQGNDQCMANAIGFGSRLAASASAHSNGSGSAVLAISRGSMQDAGSIHDTTMDSALCERSSTTAMHAEAATKNDAAADAAADGSNSSSSQAMELMAYQGTPTGLGACSGGVPSDIILHARAQLTRSAHGCVLHAALTGDARFALMQAVQQALMQP